MKTIINKATGKVLFATLDDSHIPLDGELAIDNILTESFISPYFNQTTNEFYEGATEQEILDNNKSKVPFSVTKRQLKQALLLSNIPLQNIDFAISQISNPIDKALMEIFWNDSNEFERNHPKLIEFSVALGISEEQADNLFILASKL